MRRPTLRLPQSLRRPLWALLLLAAAGCYDRGFGEAATDGPSPAVNISLADLQRLFVGQPVTIEKELIVAGRVTTSDRSGNFYRSLVIESEGGALEIMAGLDALHNDYPVGSLLTLHLEGLALGRSYGVLQAGRPAEAGSTLVGYIGSQAALDRCLHRGSEPLAAPEPRPIAIPDLQQAFCGLLVRIEGLHYAPVGLEERSWAGYHRFADADGNALFTNVSSYADFAAAEVPYGSCTLTGILQYSSREGGRYLIKLRDATDYRP